MSCEEFIRAIATGSLHASELGTHAHACADCRTLWEADRVLQLRSVAVPALSPSAALRGALQRAEQAPARAATGSSATKRLVTILVPIGLCLALALTWSARADLTRGLPASFWIGGAALCALLAIAVQLHLYRGPLGFGLARWARWTYVASVVLGFQLFAALHVFHPALAAGVKLPRDCLWLGLATGFSVASAAFLAMRRSVLVYPTAAGALGGCIGGVAAVTFLHVHCAAPAGPHLQIVHTLPLVLTVLFGALAGRRWLAA